MAENDMEVAKFVAVTNSPTVVSEGIAPGDNAVMASVPDDTETDDAGMPAMLEMNGVRYVRFDEVEKPKNDKGSTDK